MPRAVSEALPVVQRTPEWLEARQHGIGASEAAAALGLSRWDSPVALWARKLGLVPQPEPSIAMEIGAITEPLNAARYEAATGIPARRVNRLLRSRRFPFLLASLDRRRADGRLVELKWTERADGYGEPGTDEVPDEVLCQVVQQMAVTGADAADVSVLFGGRRHAIYTVTRDLRAEATVIDRLADFWQHVEHRIEPALDGSDATLETLRAIYPHDDGSTLEAGPDLVADLAAYRDAKAEAAELEKWTKELYARITAAIGSATTVIAPGVGTATFKAPKDSTVVDWPAIAVAYRGALERIWAGMTTAETWPDDLTRVVADPLAIEARHTTTKANSRRLTTTWQEETHA